MKGKRKMLWLFAALCLVLCMGGKAEAKEKGFQDVDGKVFYYKNGEKQKNWVQIKGKWYYFNKKGVMQTGWVGETATRPKRSGKRRTSAK